MAAAAALGEARARADEDGIGALRDVRQLLPPGSVTAASNILVAASSTADRRVGRTPFRASARAPSADASANVAGSAMGTDARTAVNMSVMMSPRGQPKPMRIGQQRHNDRAAETGEIAHDRQYCLLPGPDDPGGAHQFRGAAEPGACSGRGDLRHRLTASYQGPGTSLHTRHRLRSASVRP